jgi:hypothetical protein
VWDQELCSSPSLGSAAGSPQADEVIVSCNAGSALELNSGSPQSSKSSDIESPADDLPAFAALAQCSHQ